MNSNEKFWVSIWNLPIILIALVIVAIMYSEYLDSKVADKAIKKGLQSYKVSKCYRMATYTEWHEAGWKPSTTELTVKEN